MAGLTASGALAAGPITASGAMSIAQDGLDRDVQTSPGETNAPVTNDGNEGETETAPAQGQSSLQTLDDLIPQDAVENALDWAGQGTQSDNDVGDLQSSPGPNAAPSQSPVDGEGLSAELPVTAPFNTDATLNALTLPMPQPLERDPDLPSLADIETPELIEIEELVEFVVSDELVLAFPKETGRFPEEAEFVQRFRALSSIEALESDQDTVPQLAARARSDEELLVQMLRTYGYYAGEVVRQLSGGRRGIADAAGGDAGERRDASDGAVDTQPKVRFDVIPGNRYRFGAINLGAFDALPSDGVEDLRAAFGIRVGDPLYADKIVIEERRLRLALGENGYPFAELGEPSLLIDHAREEGDLTLSVSPNGKFAFGEVLSSDPDFLSSRHLQRIARFDPGDIYQTSMQADLRRAILATGLVSQVVITPRETQAPLEGQPGAVALDIALERAPLRTISGAIGFGTEDGVKVEAAWEHRNLFPPEGALRLRGILGTREQLASVTYRRSNFQARDQVLTIDAYVSDIETEAVDARTVALRGSFERVSNLLFQKPLSWQVGAEMLYTDERNRVTNGVQRPRQTYLIGGLFGSATLDSSDDLLDPTTGYRVTGFLAPEVSRSLGAESFYLRAQIDGSVYHDTGPAVIAGRIRAATIQGAQAGDIAPSRRLYAGGGGSVRGYGFQGIGPRNTFDEPTGGGSLVEFALEARVQTGLLDGAVEFVPFVDAGSVATGSSPDFSQIQFGAGVGVRYKTSFGPIRVDVGVPLNPTQFDAPVVVYVSLGQAF
ncbi:autotransporter assembly complex protein TamA [Erythrobacter sp. Alg231-14]|uniref:autotransporter assembly complex protein TamA n=1 Tax=Erythrobacter sp. Alg231-14 TaxID=1922225 RepID=UPI00307B5BD2